jgi:hypothetical protein
MALTNREIIALEEVFEGLDSIQELVLHLQRKVETIQDQGTVHTDLSQFFGSDKHNKL